MQRLLDLFCGQGGAAKGYADAGFEVIGVDITAQPRYPFEFIQADSLEYLKSIDCSRFDAIHASPPCQHYSRTRTLHPNTHPDLVDPVRALLSAKGLPYVIENVPGAPLNDPVVLCGEMFGLRVIRHRLFETNWGLPALPHVPHQGSGKRTHEGWTTLDNSAYITVAGNLFKLDDGRKAMGISWMTRRGLSQAVPPAYTLYIGRCLIKYLSEK